MRLLLGPGEHYAAGWLNLDCAEAVANGVQADQIVESAHPFDDFDTATADQVYLGHVLEHVEWPLVPRLLAAVLRVLRPGGRVLVVGPDVFRSLQEWRAGLMPDELLHAVLERAGLSCKWPEATHKWNCSEDRVVDLLQAAGFDDVAPTDDFDGWPVTGWSGWQCAVGAVAP